MLAGPGDSNNGPEIIKATIMIKANINKHLSVPGILLNNSHALYHPLNFSSYEIYILKHRVSE